MSTDDETRKEWTCDVVIRVRAEAPEDAAAILAALFDFGAHVLPIDPMLIGVRGAANLPPVQSDDPDYGDQAPAQLEQAARSTFDAIMGAPGI